MKSEQEIQQITKENLGATILMFREAEQKKREQEMQTVNVTVSNPTTNYLDVIKMFQHVGG